MATRTATQSTSTGSSKGVPGARRRSRAPSVDIDLIRPEERWHISCPSASEAEPCRTPRVAVPMEREMGRRVGLRIRVFAVCRTSRFAGASCRRRDSNPRHADYDPSPPLRPSPFQSPNRRQIAVSGASHSAWVRSVLVGSVTTLLPGGRSSRRCWSLSRWAGRAASGGAGAPRPGGDPPVQPLGRHFLSRKLRIDGRRSPRLRLRASKPHSKREKE
jgi:hypothetical protein